jgi:hypothetical protein
LIKKCINSRGGKTSYRILFLTNNEESENICEEMRKKIDLPENKILYSHRMGIIEPVFSDIEYCKGMNRFTLRSKKKVNSQWHLYSTVHNIGKCVPKYQKKYGLMGG